MEINGVEEEEKKKIKETMYLDNFGFICNPGSFRGNELFLAFHSYFH